MHLSDWFTSHDASLLALDTSVWDDPRITLVTSDKVEAIDRDAQIVTTASGTTYSYDRLVLATGSWAWAPRAEGKDLPGSFSYRTVEDVERLAEWVTTRGKALGRPLRGMVVGGGVLGLEAAAALKDMDVDTTVVEFADRLMSVQLDQGGGEMLRLPIKDLGIAVRTGVGATRFTPAGDGAMGTAYLSDETELPVDVVVFSTGIRPRDRAGPRGRARDRRARRRGRRRHLQDLRPGDLGHRRVRVLRRRVRRPHRPRKRHGRRRRRPLPGRRAHPSSRRRRHQAQRGGRRRGRLR